MPLATNPWCGDAARGEEIQMIARVMIFIASLLATAPAMAQSMSAERLSDS